MANLQEIISWDAGIYQLETSDPVLGGPGGTSNHQAQALTNRSAWLKKHIDDLEEGTTPAGKADQLSIARNIALAGDITGQATFDGSDHISITATYKNSGVTAGTYRAVTVDAKGNITAGANPTTLADYGITDALSISGTAVAAEKIATARAFTIGAVEKLFDGTASVTWALDELGFTQSMLAAGWQMLPSGLIIQWGGATGNDDVLTATYPISFPNRVMQAVATMADKTSGEYGGITLFVGAAELTSKTTLTIKIEGNDGLGNPSARWFAIGY